MPTIDEIREHFSKPQEPEDPKKERAKSVGAKFGFRASKLPKPLHRNHPRAVVVQTTHGCLGVENTETQFTLRKGMRVAEVVFPGILSPEDIDPQAIFEELEAGRIPPGINSVETRLVDPYRPDYPRHFMCRSRCEI